MADDVDMAAVATDEHLRFALVTRQPAPLPSPAGMCVACELDSPRLFAGQCAWCHDGRERPEAAQPEPTLTVTRAPGIVKRAERRQLNANFNPEQYAMIGRGAAAEGCAASAWARGVVLDAIEPAPSFERGRKPFIPAAAIRAARDAGQPLDVFVTRLIIRGLASFQADTSNEGARA